MRSVILMSGLPSRGNHGGAITCWGVTERLRKEGHDVTVVSMYDAGVGNPYLEFRDSNLAQLHDLGVRVETIPYADREIRSGSRSRRLAGMLLGELRSYYPWAALKRSVGDALTNIRPDAVFAYHFEALAAIDGLGLENVVGGVGDPTHLPELYRLRMRDKRSFTGLPGSTVKQVLNRWGYPRSIRRLMNQCAVQGAFAAHHADWYARNNLRNTRYLRTPVWDPVGNGWAALRRERQTHNHRPRVLLMGDLSGTVSKSSIELLRKVVLPDLDQRLGPDSYEVHAIGGGIGDQVRSAFDSDNIFLRGHVEPPDDDFLAATVLLVAAPIPLGVRVRILVGFSYGCCIVAHSANAMGIPELANGVNALIGATGEDIAKHVASAIEDGELRSRLERGGRETYERHFSLETAGAEVVRLMRLVSHESQTVG